jgi:hypothetical protein
VGVFENRWKTTKNLMLGIVVEIGSSAFFTFFWVQPE